MPATINRPTAYRTPRACERNLDFKNPRLIRAIIRELGATRGGVAAHELLRFTSRMAKKHGWEDEVHVFERLMAAGKVPAEFL